MAAEPIGARPAAPARDGSAVRVAHRRLAQVLCLDDFEAAARRALPRPLFEYIAGAAETNQSFERNRSQFREWSLVPRALVDVSKRDMSVTLLGQRWRAPVGIAPMGITAISAYRGDLVLARAAQEAGIPMVMSGSSLIPMEAVVAAAPGTWFQAYLPGRPEQIDALIARVRTAGYGTLVITIDTPVAANRENNLRAGFSTPLRPSLRLAWEGVTHPRWLFGTFVKTLLRHGMPHFENNYAERGAPILSRNVLRDYSDRGHIDWSTLASIRRMWQGPLVVKGILHPDDAVAAVRLGADALVVSNHGGRQLDGAVAPLRVLPRIVDAVGDTPVLLDSGVRRGTDVLKAIALGARMVLVGRPFSFAGAVAGPAGVAHAIELITSEVKRDMGLLGVTRLDDIGPQHLHDDRTPVAPPARGPAG